MKVRVNTELCQGHGMCWLNCPEVFQLSDEDGHAYVENEAVPPALEYSVDVARRSCPERAVEIYG